MSRVLVSGATAAGQALPALQQLCVDPVLAKTLVAGQTHTFEFTNSVTPEITATVKEVTDIVKSGDLHRFFSIKALVPANGFFSNDAVYQVRHLLCT